MDNQSDNGTFAAFLMAQGTSESRVKIRIQQVAEALNVPGVPGKLMDHLTEAQEDVRRTYRHDSIKASARVAALKQWHDFCHLSGHDPAKPPEYERSS